MAKRKPPSWQQAKYQPVRSKVGVTWYEQAEWARVKAAASDPDRFEASYEAWRKMANDSMRQLQAAGTIATKVAIKADELLAWCLLHNKPNDAAARAQFVAGRTEIIG